MMVARTLRCAVYTRVSTEHGLDQEFNSLDAQREACEAYIKSQVGEGWRLVPTHYDDGGYSGGSMDRPALQQLLTDVRAGLIDIIVVYKVDRLTRSLADFAKLVELFDSQGVSFVSVTQSFNTTSSMGRLTLNVLLSFAQFEREVTGERIRDKIAASKKKGLRMGGPVPLGYGVTDKKLVAEQAEAETVRAIFEGYLQSDSLSDLVLKLHRDGIVTKQTELKDGRTRGGVAFRKSALAYLLRNRVYVGEVVHKGRYFAGEHQPIVPTELFNAVQRKLDAQMQGEPGPRLNIASPLAGKLFDDRGNRMVPSTTTKAGVRYRYYVSAALTEGRKHEAGSVRRVPASELETTIRAAVEAHLSPESGAANAEPERVERDAIALVTRAIIRKTKIELSLDGTGSQPTLTVAWSPPPSRPRRELINADATKRVQPIRSETRARLVEGIAKARLWVDDLLAGRVTSTHDIARREKLSERSVRMTLNLAFLAPQIVQAAVDGTLPRQAGLCRLKLPRFDGLFWAFGTTR
jgi:DNA invertase Pin-like site-specific DNA recombinase